LTAALEIPVGKMHNNFGENIKKLLKMLTGFGIFLDFGSK